jgi:hypothetical protein
MSELLPTLRESLRETAERRYPRPRRRARLVPAAVAVAAVVAALLILRGADRPTSPADEVPATPTPTVTFTPTPTPTPTPVPTARSIPKLSAEELRATPVAPDSPSLKEALSLMDDSHQVVRAWKVPGLEGHVLLTRKGDEWCLSAPDPLTDSPDAERGVGCGPDSRFQQRGAYIGIGNVTVTVQPDQKTIRVRQR